LGDSPASPIHRAAAPAQRNGRGGSARQGLAPNSIDTAASIASKPHGRMC